MTDNRIRGRGLRRAVGAVAGALALAVTSLVAVPTAGQAMYEEQYRFPTHGAYGQDGELSAVKPFDGTGWPAWCIQAGNKVPGAMGSMTPATLSESKMWGPAELDLTTPQAAWLLQDVGKDMPAKTEAAVAYLMHANFETGTNWVNPDPQVTVNHMVNEVKTRYPEIHKLAGELAKAARASAAVGYEGGKVEGEAKRTGFIQGIAVAGANGYLAGNDVSVELSGPAVFDDTGTKSWSGKSKTEPIVLNWTATGNGKVTYKVKFKNVPRRTLTKYAVQPGSEYQDTLSYGNRPGSDPEELVKPGPTWEVIYDFQPTVKSNVPDKTVDLGDVLEDVLTVEADPNYGSGEWFKVEDSEDYVPVTFEGTAYLVGDLPVETPTEVPADAKVIGTTSFVAEGPGEYRAKLDKPAEESGFVTWVWKMVKENQAEEFIEFIHDDFSDQYGVAEETTSVRHEFEIDSSLSIRETKSGTYLVDDLFVDGMPDDHPNFAGGAGFEADVAEMTQKLLFFPKGEKVADDNVDAAEVIGELTIPAKNGFYPNLGSTKFKMKNDVAGTYVFVTSFAGDDRVRELTTSVTDSTEQYVVDQPLKVTTKATPEISVGEKAHDTAIVEGTVPAGATVGFELFKADGEAKECTPENKVFTSKQVKLNGPGEYVSEETVLTEAGTYYWVETVRNSDGATMHRGECGLPDETTIVKDNDGDGAGRGGGLAKTGVNAGIIGGFAAVLGLAGGAGVIARRKFMS